MRTFGFTLMMLACLSALLALGSRAVPFRIPLTSEEELHAALVLIIAGAVALLGSRT